MNYLNYRKNLRASTYNLGFVETVLTQDKKPTAIEDLNKVTEEL